MKYLKHICIVLSILFMVVITLETFGIFLSGNQFIYNLSLLPREDAEEIVLNLHTQNIAQMEMYGVDISEDYVTKMLGKYLDEASQLKPHEKMILRYKDEPIVKRIGIYISISDIISLITYELLSARKDEKAATDIITGSGS